MTMLKKLATSLWRCEQGSVGSAELVFLVTMLSIGLVVAAKSLRDTAVTELADFAQSIANLDQSYNVPDLVLDDNGTPGDPSDDIVRVGSGFIDRRDFCDVDANDSTNSSNVDGSGGSKFPTCTPIQFGVLPNGGETTCN